MTKPPLIDVPVSSAAELLQRCRMLLEPPVFGARSLWLAWLDDGFMVPLVIPVDDVPAVPDTRLISGVLHLNDVVAEEKLTGQGHLALALCRPGSAVITEDDDEWGYLLHEMLDDQLEITWSLHLAAGGQVVPLVDAPAWAFRSRRT